MPSVSAFAVVLAISPVLLTPLVPAILAVPVPSVLVAMVILLVPPMLVALAAPVVTLMGPSVLPPSLVDSSARVMPRRRGLVAPLVVPGAWVIVIQRFVDQVAYCCARQHFTEVPSGVCGPGGIDCTGQRNGYDKSYTSETDGTWHLTHLAFLS